MGTQAVVSIRQGGKMAMKIVVGCNGMKAPALAQAIKDLGRVPNVFDAQQMAQKVKLGCTDCLVVTTPSARLIDITTVTDPEKLEKLEGDELYHKTFDDPEFNPRWHYGTADYVEVVDL